MLDLYITQDPNVQDEGTWRHVGGAELHEWNAVFFDALGCEPYTSDEDMAAWEERAKLKFQKIAIAYPLE